MKSWTKLYDKAISQLEFALTNPQHFGKKSTFDQIDSYFEKKVSKLNQLCKEAKKLPKDKDTEIQHKIIFSHFYYGVALYFSSYRGACREEKKAVDAYTQFQTAIDMAKAGNHQHLKSNLAERFRFFLFRLKNFCKEPDSLFKYVAVLDGLLDAYHYVSLLEDKGNLFLLAEALVIHYWNKRQLPQASLWLSTVVNLPFAGEKEKEIENLKTKLKVSAGLKDAKDKDTLTLKEFEDLLHILIIFASVDCGNNKAIIKDVSEISQMMVRSYDKTLLKELFQPAKYYLEAFDDELVNFEESNVILILKRMSYFFNIHKEKIPRCDYLLMKWKKIFTMDDEKPQNTLAELIKFNEPKKIALLDKKSQHNVISFSLRTKPVTKLESNVAYLSMYIQKIHLDDLKELGQFNHLTDKILEEMKKQSISPQSNLWVLMYFNRGFANLMMAKEAYDISLALEYLKKSFELLDDGINYSILQKHFLKLALLYPIDIKSKIEKINAVLGVLKGIRKDWVLVEIYCQLLSNQLSIDVNGFCKTFSDVLVSPNITIKDINKLVRSVFLSRESTEDVSTIGPFVITTLMASEFNLPKLISRAVKHFNQHLKLEAKTTMVSYLVQHVKQNDPQAHQIVSQIKQHFIEPQQSHDETVLNQWEQEVTTINHFLDTYDFLETIFNKDKMDHQNTIIQIDALLELKFGKEKPEKYDEIVANLMAEKGKARLLLAYQESPHDEKRVQHALSDYETALKIDRPTALRRKIFNQLIQTMQTVSANREHKSNILQDLESAIDVVKKSVRSTEALFLEQAFLISINYLKILEPKKALEFAKKANAYLIEKLPFQEFSSINQYCQEQAIQQAKIVRYIEAVNLAEIECCKLAKESGEILKIIQNELAEIKKEVNPRCIQSLTTIAKDMYRMYVIKERIRNQFTSLSQKMGQFETLDLFDSKGKVQEKLNIIKDYSSTVNQHAIELEKLSEDLNTSREKIDGFIQNEINFHKRILENARREISRLAQATQSSSVLANAKKQQAIAQTAQKLISKHTDDKLAILRLDLGQSNTTQAKRLKIEYFPKAMSELKKDVQKIEKRVKDKEDKALAEASIAQNNKEKKELNEKLHEMQQEFKNLKKEFGQLVSVSEVIKKLLIKKTNEFNDLVNTIVLKYKKVPKKIASELKIILDLLKECEQIVEICQTIEIEKRLLKERKAETEQLTAIVNQASIKISQINLELKDATLDTYKELRYQTKKHRMLINDIYTDYPETCDETLRNEIIKLNDIIETTLDKLRALIQAASKKSAASELKTNLSGKKTVPDPLKPFFSVSLNNHETLHEFFSEKTFTHEFEWFGELVRKLHQNGICIELQSVLVILEIAKQHQIKYTETKNASHTNLYVEFKNDEEREKIKDILSGFGFKFNYATSSADSQKLTCYRGSDQGTKKYILSLDYKDKPKKPQFSYFQEPRIAFQPKPTLKNENYLCDIDDTISAVLINTEHLRNMFKKKKFDTGIPDLKNMEEYTNFYLVDFFKDVIDDRYLCYALFGFPEYDLNAHCALLKEDYIRKFFEKRHANMFLKENCYHAIANIMIREHPLNLGKIHLRMFLSVILQSHAQFITLGRLYPNPKDYDIIASEWLLPFLELVFKELPTTKDAIMEKLFFAIKFILKGIKFYTVDLSSAPFSDFSCPQNLFFRRFNKALTSSGLTPEIVLQNIEMSYQAEFDACFLNLIIREVSQGKGMLLQESPLMPLAQLVGTHGMFKSSTMSAVVSTISQASTTPLEHSSRSTKVPGRGKSTQ